MRLGIRALRKVMRKRKLSQKQVAEVAGVSQPAVCAWLANKSGPTLKAAMRMEEHLGIAAELWVPEDAETPSLTGS